MLLSSLSRRVASPSTAAMICSISARLPLAAAGARRGAAPLAPCAPMRSFITRAQKEPQPQPEAGAQGKTDASESQKIQPRTGTGAELAATPRAGDLMDLPLMMPTPFRRMTDHMMQMQREMDSMLGAFGMPSPLSALADPFDIFDRVAAAPLVARRTGAGLRGALSRMVPLDVEEDDKTYTVTAEVPGFDKNEIKVSLSEDGMLTMTGAHEEGSLEGEAKEGEAKEGEAKEGAMRRGSRRYASFVRSVQLPDDADTGAISASTQHGVLTVRIPKSPKPAPKTREIPVA